MARKRRSFPIPLDSRYADREVAVQVVIDLVHKHPRGPLGDLTAEDYYYGYTDPGLRDAEHGMRAFCGYNPVSLYRMVLKLTEITDTCPTSEWDYRNLVRSLWPDLGDRGVTRRSRRLAARLGTAVNYVRRQGLPGIWSVNWGYGHMSTVKVHANSSQDACNMAKMFFGPIIGDLEHRVHSSFEREGSPLELLNANDSMIKALDQEQENAKKRIEKLQQQIEEYETNKSFVQMYAINCMTAAEEA